MRGQNVMAAEVEHLGCKVNVYYDDDPINPWKEWENLGGFPTWHNRYNLGDGNKEFTRPDDFHEWWKVNGKGGVLLQIYLYDHSGLTISSKPFSCPWDSGQVGYMYCTREQMRVALGVKRVTAKVRKRATEILESQVESYDKYLRGECFYFTVEDSTGEVVESCSGFDDSDVCLEEGKNAAEAWVKSQEPLLKENSAVPA